MTPSPPPGSSRPAEQQPANDGEAAVAAAPPPAAAAPPASSVCTVVGQLTFRRAVSKKLVFYDMLCSSMVEQGQMREQERGQEQLWLEVVVKLGCYGTGTIEELEQLRSGVKLGDIVSVQGRLAGRHEVQASSVVVLKAWREQHPLQTFRPQPSPLHGGAAQQQRQQQHSQQQPPAGNRAEALPSILAAATAAAGPIAAAEAGGAAGVTGGAAGAAGAALPACKYFINTGRCSKGDACRFAHLHTEAMRQHWVGSRLAERRVLSSAQGFAHSGGAAAKRRRAQVLAAWLVQTYGRDLLNSGEGVLDVAGGAGGVTFELQHAHGIRCTLVDPRPLKLNKQQLRQLQAAGRVAAIHTASAAQLQMGAEGTLLAGALDQAPAGQPGTTAAPEDDAAAVADTFHQVQAHFGPELWRSPGWRTTFSHGFSLVLACHPDQATEPVLDYALEAALPFAIVPCCVFPRLFPHRRILGTSSNHSGSSIGTSSTGTNGGGSNHSGSSTGASSTGTSGGGSAEVPEEVPVLTYRDLVTYLVAKGRAQQAVLGFEGANIVVYRGAPAAAGQHAPGAAG